MSKTNSNETKFEDALDRLENIIGMLQGGSLTLDESLKTFEEGISLVRICQERLDKSESKIELLLKDCNGNISKVPFDAKTEE